VEKITQVPGFGEKFAAQLHAFLAANPPATVSPD
jgi:hypothetical protein